MTDALWTLTLLVGILLLIVCANLANLLLSRSVGRQRESSVRLALGAPRGRLFRLHLIECGILALLGGIASVGIGYALSHFMILLTQSGSVPTNELDLSLNWRVMAFSLAAALLTALLFGIAPSWRAAKADINHTLKNDSRSVTGGLKLPRVLASLQFAFCFVALIAAGLLTRSVTNLASFDVGFRSEGIYYATLNPSRVGYTPERTGAFLERLLQEIEAIPGVTAATPLADRLLSGGGSTTSVTTPWGPPERLENGQFNPEATVFEISGGARLIETLRVPLVSGTSMAGDARPEVGNAIIDEAFARRFPPNRNPIGQQIEIERRPMEIVGVVRTIREFNVRDKPLPAIYLPMDLASVRRAVHIAIRTAIPSEQLAAALRQRVASIDAGVPVMEFTSQTELTGRLFGTDRLLALVGAAFGIAATLLAAIGLFGLLAYTVARRRNEIGVRMALGAKANDIVRMILRESAWMVVAGVGIGLPAAYAIARYLKASLFGLDPVDPVRAAFAWAVLLLVALAAALLPARRAAHVDPVSALRDN